MWRVAPLVDLVFFTKNSNCSGCYALSHYNTPLKEVQRTSISRLRPATTTAVGRLLPAILSLSLPPYAALSLASSQTCAKQNTSPPKRATTSALKPEPKTVPKQTGKTIDHAARRSTATKIGAALTCDSLPPFSPLAPHPLPLMLSLPSLYIEIIPSPPPRQQKHVIAGPQNRA